MLIIALMTTASGFSQQSKITVKGSDTMVILAQKWAELYMKKNPSATIQVTGGGSGVGITALINGTTDICNSSRPMKQ
ncbi:MAG: substrate-binding domain-containing protein, partial [Bacteroidia bacterium]|nr:substrate-binding domain-containing protein [Bacteroidia bacterium]